MNGKKVLLAFIWIGIIFLTFVLIRWQSANVVLELPEQNYKVGDKLNTQIEINDVNSNSNIILILYKENEVVNVENINYNDLAMENDNYLIQTDKIIDYTFNESGNYKIEAIILNTDKIIEKKIIVE